MEMDSGAIKNFRDFLQLYNKMSELCFGRCINNVNSRKLSDDEIECVEECSAKFIKFNNKLMQNFVKAQSEIVNRRVEEAQKQNEIEVNSAQFEQTSEQTQLEDNPTSLVTVENHQGMENGSIQEKGPDQSKMSIAK